MKDSKYIFLVGLHVFLGLLIYAVRPVSKIYSLAILAVGLYFVIKTRNARNEVLIVSAYVVGSEVFLRMTGGNLLYESSKYAIMIFMAIGMYYSGFSKNAVPFWIYMLLLLPGIFVATETLNLHTDIRKAIAFNISGPACLGVAAIYCYNRKILLSQLNNIILAFGLPVLSTAVYLILYTPELQEVLTGTGSNIETSGGIEPNQVTTIIEI